MAGSMNMCIFSGRLTADPEFSMAGETPKAVFSIAVDEGYVDRSTGEVVKKTMFPRIQVYGALVEAVVRKYCTKGKWVEIACKYEERTYDPPEGDRRYYKEFKIDQVTGRIVLGPDGNGNGNDNGNMELLFNDFSTMIEFKDQWTSEEVKTLMAKMIENRSRKKEKPVKVPATNGPDESAGPIPF